MNIKEIKQLLALIKEHELAEFEMEREGTKIVIKKYPASTTVTMPSMAHTMMVPPMNNAVPATQVSEPKVIEEKNDNLVEITSPIVGTFYAASSPEAPAFVSVGSKIGINDTVCIVEAMKVMNEIKAEVSGVIEEILVENGQVVEFGQVLFKVKK